jgi:uncharacterized protein involved in exopolysaccharide biosynthesis
MDRAPNCSRKAIPRLETKESQAVETTEPISVILPLLGRWKLLVICTLVGALSGFVVSTLQPRIYESRATIYANQSRTSASILSGLPIAINSGLGIPSGYYTALLESDTMIGNVITRLKLLQLREFTHGRRLNMQEATRCLKRSVDVKENRSGTVDILTRSTSPYLAARIGNTMLDCLGGMVVTASRRKVVFISGKLDETMRDLRNAEDDMRRFLEANDIAAIDEQTKALIEEMSALDGQLLALDVESQQLSSRLATAGELDSLVDDEVQRRAVESSRSFVMEKRAKLQEKLARLPEVATKYARLERRISVLNRTFEMLTQQYQLERITQQGEDGDYQIIDRARPDKLKISPRTAVNTGVGGALAFALAALAISAFAPVRKYKKGY